MRIAIVSDIHGNRTAFEAVLADLRQTSPDLILHGGDLADGGASPVEIVDRMRDLGWEGVVGNTDEMLFRPESLDEFASQSSAPPSLWAAIREMAAATRGVLGEERLAWLRGLPPIQIQAPMALVHASPKSPLALTGAGRERCRIGVGLFATRPADCDLWAHPSVLHSERCRPGRRQHRQR